MINIGVIASSILKVITPVLNPFAYYRFDNNLIDQVNVLNGVGTNTSFITGKSGNAVDFNGITSYITIDDNNLFSFTDGVNDKSFSVSFFIKFDTVRSTFIIEKRNDPNYEYQINYNGTSFVVVLYSQGSASSFLLKLYSFTPIPSTWYHLTITYNGNKTHNGINMYINAVIGGVGSLTGTYNGMSNTISVVTIGKRNFLNDLYLDGAIDGLSFWNRELSQLEITNNYNTQSSGIELI